MLKKFKELKNSILFQCIVGEKNKNLFLLIFTIIPSVLAGLMEGLSYGGILLAVNVIRGETINSLPIFSFLLKYIQPLSANRQFLFFIIFALFIQLIRSGFIFISQYIVSRISMKTTTEIQHRIYTQIFNFSYPFVSKYQAGDLINYNSSPSIVPIFLTHFNNAFSSLAIGLISLACLIKIDYILTIFLLLSFISVNFLYKSLIKKMSNLSTDLTKDEVKFSSQTNQNINGIKLIHMFYK
ncbi:MAG: ABC transporter transmembrane domain-containing protein, partial [Parachlamydiales bacterium]